MRIEDTVIRAVYVKDWNLCCVERIKGVKVLIFWGIRIWSLCSLCPQNTLISDRGKALKSRLNLLRLLPSTGCPCLNPMRGDDLLGVGVANSTDCCCYFDTFLLFLDEVY